MRSILFCIAMMIEGSYVYVFLFIVINTNGEIRNKSVILTLFFGLLLIATAVMFRMWLRANRKNRKDAKKSLGQRTNPKKVLSGMNFNNTIYTALQGENVNFSYLDLDDVVNYLFDRTGRKATGVILSKKTMLVTCGRREILIDMVTKKNSGNYVLANNRAIYSAEELLEEF